MSKPATPQPITIPEIEPGTQPKPVERPYKVPRPRINPRPKAS